MEFERNKLAIERLLPEAPRRHLLLDFPALVGKLLEEHEGDLMREAIRALSEA